MSLTVELSRCRQVPLCCGRSVGRVRGTRANVAASSRHLRELPLSVRPGCQAVCLRPGYARLPTFTPPKLGRVYDVRAATRPSPRPPAPSLTPRVRLATGRAATRQELQDYLGAHKIQERLNDWLNEMVKERPAAPYAWLATRMRSGSAGALGPQSSVPELKSPAAKEAFGDLSRSWDYLMAYQGISPGASQGASAASAAPSGPGELLLSIEPSAGTSPLVLAIRPK